MLGKVIFSSFQEMSMGQYILDLFSSIRRDPRVLQPQSVTAEPIRAPAIGKYKAQLSLLYCLMFVYDM